MGSDARLLALIWLSAISCRAPILAVGPILPRIIEDLALSHTAAGLLFALPVFAMGAASLFGGIVADRVGAARVIAAGLLVVSASGALRATRHTAVLFGATALLGGAIGCVQAALPRSVRERFPDRIGLATAIYSAGFTVGSLLAVTLTATWLAPMAGGWRGTVMVWAALAALPVVFWWPHVARPAKAAGRLEAVAFRAVLRDRLLWRIALVQAMNSATFFGATAWLTAWFEGRGWGPERASWPLAVATAAGGVAGFLAPVASDRLRARRGLFVGSCAVTAAGLAGFLVSPDRGVWLWSAAYGIGIFASFTLNLAMPVDVSPPARVGAASGFVFAVAYGGALVGPFAVGLLKDLTGRFEAGLWAMLAMAVVMTALAVSIPETFAGRDRDRPDRARPD